MGSSQALRRQTWRCGDGKVQISDSEVRWWGLVQVFGEIIHSISSLEHRESSPKWIQIWTWKCNHLPKSIWVKGWVALGLQPGLPLRPRLLISNKADVHSRNAEGRRPIDVPWSGPEWITFVVRKQTEVFGIGSVEMKICSDDMMKSEFWKPKIWALESLFSTKLQFLGVSWFRSAFPTLFYCNTTTTVCGSPCISNQDWFTA